MFARNEFQSLSDTSLLFKLRTERSKLRAGYSLMDAEFRMKKEGIDILKKIDVLNKQIDGITQKLGNSQLLGIWGP